MLLTKLSPLKDYCSSKNAPDITEILARNLQNDPGNKMQKKLIQVDSARK